MISCRKSAGKKNVCALMLGLGLTLSALTPILAQETDDSGQTSQQSKETLSETDRMRLTIALTDDDIRQLKKHGRLSQPVHELFRNRVASVVIRHVNCYRSDAARLAVDPTVDAGTCQTPVTSQLAERIRFEPVEFRVFEKEFDRVDLVWAPHAEFRWNETESEIEFSTEQFRININNAGPLSARVGEFDSFSLKTEIGEFAIELNRVRRIDFDKSLATISLDGGSRLTGRLSGEDLQLQTSWGHVTVSINDITSITRNTSEALLTQQNRNH